VALQRHGWDALDSTNEDEVIRTFVAETARRLDIAVSRADAVAITFEARQHQTLASFSAQEDFEHQLAMYFAEKLECRAIVLLGVADAMGWSEDMRRLATLNPGLASHLGGKIYAARGLDHLDGLRARNRMAGRILLGKFRPAAFRFGIFDAYELAELNQFIDDFRWVNFTGLADAPDPMVLAWWSQYGRTPRITFAKAVFAALLGLAAAALLGMGAPVAGAPPRYMVVVASFLSGALVGLGFLVLFVGLPWLWWRYRPRAADRVPNHPLFQFGWIPVVPAVLLLSLLWPASSYWPLWLALCVALIMWLVRVSRFPIEFEAMFFEGFFCLVIAFWAYRFFYEPNVFVALSVAILGALYMLSLSRFADLLLQAPMPFAALLEFGWILPLAYAAGTTAGSPFADDTFNQALRVLWFVSVLWGVAFTSFYPERLKNLPWIGMVLLSLAIANSGLVAKTGRTEGVSPAIAASLVTLLFFLANRVPSLHARLRS
jgi:hypothetical protein